MTRSDKEGSVYQKADVILKALGLVGGAIAFTVGLHQYERGQAWQRATVVLALIDTFEKDDMIEAAQAMLDMDSVSIQHREDDSQEILEFRFENSMLAPALRVVVMDRVCEGQQRAGDECFTPEQDFIRQAFTGFLDFFERLASLEKAGLVESSDLSYFNYWLELLRDAERYKKDAAIQLAIDDYIDYYNFRGTRRLLDEYSQRPEPLRIMGEAPVEDLARPRL